MNSTNLLTGAASAAELISTLARTSSTPATDGSTNTKLCETCGWLAAMGAMLAFGSFGVPIKSDACQRVQVDPLVFQSYKTAMCFFTSWLILLFGYEFTFTPWGIVSGLFWVPGGVATIWAVQCAGLAVAIGIGSTGIVLVSFIWGIFVFQEPVRSKWGACFAVAVMMTGLYGMAYFSTPTSTTTTTTTTTSSSSGSAISLSSDAQPPLHHDDLVAQQSISHVEELNNNAGVDRPRTRKGGYRGVAQDVTGTTDPQEDGFQSDCEITTATNTTVTAIDAVSALGGGGQVAVTLPGGRIVKLPKRHVGICAAVFNGAWGGSIMAPMKWCHRDDTNGIGFLLSFAIGASIVNLGLWVIRYFYLVMTIANTSNTTSNRYSLDSWYQAYQMLPSFHLRELWCAGAACGLLWSVGNFFSLISVQYLGQGVGYSVIQAAMLVAGLWGICYFREVTRPDAIAKWFLSASLTVSGILLLSYEHHKAR